MSGCRKAAFRREEILDLSSLAELGKVAGVAGVAIGMIVLIVRPMVEGAKDLPDAERAPMFRMIAIGAFAIGGLGILAWLVANIAAPPAGGGGKCSATSGGFFSGGNKVDCNLPASSAETKP
jgi:hypothetical protein